MIIQFTQKNGRPATILPACLELYLIQFTQKNGRPATIPPLNIPENKFSLLRKMVGLQRSSHAVRRVMEFSLLRKMVGLQQSPHAIPRACDSVYSEKWSACNWTRAILRWPIIQFTQKNGRPATSGATTFNVSEIQFLLRKMVGLQPRTVAIPSAV